METLTIKLILIALVSLRTVNCLDSKSSDSNKHDDSGISTYYFADEETKCPEPKSIMPCTCAEIPGTLKIMIDCRHVSRKKVKEALMKVPKRRNIVLSLINVNLKRLPKHFFKGMNIKMLILEACHFDSLSNDEDHPALLGLEDTLEDLFIRKSITGKAQRMPKLKLNHLRYLRFFTLTANKIHELTDDFFQGLPISLEFITLDKNKIKKLGKHAFAHLKNLRHISLNNNPHINIQRSMFPDGVVSLSLVGCALKSLPKDIFKGMSRLLDIDLHHNRIKWIKSETWKEVWEKLYYVDLSENPLQCGYHLHWMMELLLPARLTAACAVPKEEAGVPLVYYVNQRKF